MKYSISTQDKDFFFLLRAGLWGRAEGTLSSNPDWEYIYRTADRHKVQGIISEGINVSGITSGIPEDIFLNFISERAYIAKMNVTVNSVQAKLCATLEENGIAYAILKGQPIGQLYPKPETRRSGDIDFLIKEEDFEKVNSFFSDFTEEEEYHEEHDLHHALHIDDVWVENHAMAKTYFTKSLDKVLEAERRRMFDENDFSVCRIDGNEILAPATEYTALFLMGHILRHLTTEGISLKQLCDWVIFCHSNSDCIDYKRFNRLLKDSGILGVWRKFSVFGVEWLGMKPNDIIQYEAGRSEYGYDVWETIQNVWRLKDLHRGKHIRNFWLHYLNEYREFIRKNNHLWHLSKRAFAERIFNKFSSLPKEFFTRFFAVGGKKFKKDRFRTEED